MSLVCEWKENPEDCVMIYYNPSELEYLSPQLSSYDQSKSPKETISYGDISKKRKTVAKPRTKIKSSARKTPTKVAVKPTLKPKKTPTTPVKTSGTYKKKQKQKVRPTKTKPVSKTITKLPYDKLDYDDLGLKIFIPGKAGLLTKPQCNYYKKHLKPILDKRSIEDKLKEYGNKIGKTTEKYGSDHILNQQDHDNCMILALEYIRVKKIKEYSLSVSSIAADYNMYDTAAEILTNNNDPMNALLFYAAKDVTGIKKFFNSNRGLNTNKKALDDPKMMKKVLSLCLDSIYRIKSDPSLLADVGKSTDESRKHYIEGAMEMFVSRYNLFNETYSNEPMPYDLVDGYHRINQDFKDVCAERNKIFAKEREGLFPDLDTPVKISRY